MRRVLNLDGLAFSYLHLAVCIQIIEKKNRISVTVYFYLVVCICKVHNKMYYLCQSFTCSAKRFVFAINLQCACLLCYDICIISSL